jgi:pyruvate, orthophosphate dikinase
VPAVNDLALLQLLRVKGLASVDAVAAALGLAPSDAQQALDRCTSEGLVKEAAAGVRLTPTGREAWAELAAAERAGIDDAALQLAYGDFCVVNDDLKATISAWQMSDESTPNDHSDEAYDVAVVERLTDVHGRATAVLASVELTVPRLSSYRRRLDAAMQRIAGGDRSFIARPIIDSYHTVWFELHEDLIGLTGRSRSAEADAGRET